jgi:hypothetical protein
MEVKNRMTAGIYRRYMCAVRAKLRTDVGTIKEGIKDVLVGVQGVCRSRNTI